MYASPCVYDLSYLCRKCGRVLVHLTCMQEIHLAYHLSHMVWVCERPSILYVDDIPPILHHSRHKDCYKIYDLSYLYQYLVATWKCTGILPCTASRHVTEILMISYPEKYRCRAFVGNLICPSHVLCKYSCRHMHAAFLLVSCILSVARVKQANQHWIMF